MRERLVSTVSFIKTVSKEWQEAEHLPNDAKYSEFIRQVSRQMDAMIDAGICVHPHYEEGQPYNSSAEMFADLDRGHLKIFTGGDEFAPGHELAGKSYFGGNWNEVFRAVHDYYGHYLTRSPFETWDGKLVAYEAHRKMFRGAALSPLYAETIGQLCVHYDTGDFVKIQKAVEIPIREVPV